MNKLDLDYQNLLKDILENGVKKETRNGKVLSVFGRTMRYKFKDGKFPLLTTKKIHFKSVVSELLWFLQGRTDLRWLLEQGNTIWVGDCYQAYLKSRKKIQQEYKEKWGDEISNNPLTQEEFINKIKTDDEFAKKWGDLGPIYGKQWREWTNLKQVDEWEWKYDLNGPIDQIANLINDLKTNPDSRRLMVSAWNVGELDQMVLPPCHYGFQVYTRELTWKERWEHYFYNVNNEKCLSEIELDKINYPKRAISLMYNCRSQDVPLGTPFNIASYALLLEIIAKMVNMIPDELITNMGDCHIYLNQIDGVKEQLTREPYELPKLKHMKTEAFFKSLSDDLSLITHLDPKDFQIEGYQSHSTIKMPLSN